MNLHIGCKKDFGLAEERNVLDELIYDIILLVQELLFFILLHRFSFTNMIYFRAITIENITAKK